MESTLLHQISPDNLRQLIREEIREHLKPPKEEQYVPKKKAAHLLNRTVQTLDTWNKEGILKKKYIGGRVYYKLSDIEKIKPE